MITITKCSLAKHWNSTSTIKRENQHTWWLVHAWRCWSFAQDWWCCRLVGRSVGRSVRSLSFKDVFCNAGQRPAVDPWPVGRGLSGWWWMDPFGHFDRLNGDRLGLTLLLLLLLDFSTTPAFACEFGLVPSSTQPRCIHPDLGSGQVKVEYWRRKLWRKRCFFFVFSISSTVWRFCTTLRSFLSAMRA